MNEVKQVDVANLYRRRFTRQVSMHTLNSFNELRLNVKLCDASLILDNGDEYPVHRSVLSGSSDYFRILFTTTLHDGENTQIFLKTVESSTMESILQYIYSRQIDLHYNNVLEVMRTADYFCIDGLVQLCHGYLIECIGTDNCVTILQFADDFYFGPLSDAAYKYIVKKFEAVAEEGNELMKLTRAEFKRLIEDNQLNVNREEYVWDVLVKWVDEDPKNRKNELVYLLPFVRFGLMAFRYFVEKVKDHRYIKNRVDCKPFIVETLKFFYNLQVTAIARDSLIPTLARPRYPFEVLFAIGGWSGGSPTAIIETYDWKSDRWTRILNEDTYGPRAYHGTIVVDHCIYILGGFDGLEYFNSCRKFDTLTKTWLGVAPMNCKRCYISVALLDGVIYAMGGFDGHHRLSSAEKYSVDRNQWTMIPSMMSERSDACAAVLNDKIYITGGFNGQECLNTVEIYDAITNVWTLIPPMRTKRSGVSCIAFRDCLHVMGGFNGLSRMKSVECFNPTTKQWSSLADMHNPRSNFAIVILDNMIFVAGGFDGITTISKVECYNDFLNEWFEVKSMQVLRSALTACVIKDLPNVAYYMPLDSDRLSEEGRAQEYERNGNQDVESVPQNSTGENNTTIAVTIQYNNAGNATYTLDEDGFIFDGDDRDDNNDGQDEEDNNGVNEELVLFVYRHEQ
ncbi:BTB/Kelch-associated,BTB-kelch protein,BTB/POZ domain,Kelch-type beta propeller,Kelch repeat type [Cinara cedri]|uniref:Kelch-like protein diablo n=1 Tax=Cinara cedri TaxID=506608 RepID=A0A5E4NTK9_9HEMI|nr:BTB/Kelch-associated,BTB-kelch protein,BTB/POZ domain,Kelch-type beta propeller,Kelch repeat type [Cinara cedri]